MTFEEEERRIQNKLDAALREYDAGDFTAALQDCEYVLLSGENALASSLAAACLLRLGRVEEAEPLARTAVRLAPHAALAHFWLAQILEAREKDNEAEAVWLDAVAADPSDPAGHCELGRFLGARGRYAEALEALNVARKIGPPDGSLSFLIAACLEGQHKYEEAIVEGEEAARQLPQDPRPLRLLGCASASLADGLFTTPPKIVQYGRAVEFFKRALELDPNHDGTRHALATAQAALERVSKPADAPPLEPARSRTPLAGLVIALVFSNQAIVRILVENVDHALIWLPIILVADVIAIIIFGVATKDFSFLPSGLFRFFDRLIAKSDDQKPGASSTESERPSAQS
jgi:tetratricopeptide (TPR) repeat protein